MSPAAATALPPAPPALRAPRQLSARRVREVISDLGWDLERFEARYAELAGPLEAGPPARGLRRGRLTVAQAARRLGLHPKTVLKYARTGKLSAWKSPGSAPTGDRYGFDEAQIAAFRRSYWHLVKAEPAGAEGA